MKVALFLVLVLVCCASLQADEAQDLIDLAMARRGAISSLHLEFVYCKQPVGKPVERFGKEILDLEHSSWATRWENNPSDALLSNHDGYFLEYQQSLDGERRYIEFQEPRVFNKIGAANAAPIYAGSFPDLSHIEMVLKNRAEFKIVGEEVVDGVPTKILELPAVSGKHVWAKYYISREMGGVVPKIEYLYENGKPFIRHLSTGFSEKAPGLWLPTKSLEEIHQNGNFHKMWFEMEFSQVNQPIADEVFRKVVPAGTTVVVARKGTRKQFVLKEQMSSGLLSKEAEQLAK